MACEDEKTQVELLELLTELQDEAYHRSYAEEVSAAVDADTACGDTTTLLLELATGEMTADDVSQECVEAVENWIDEVDEMLDEYLLWQEFADALEEAAERYTECLHESAVPF